MPKDILRYDLMVQEALKGVVRKILSDAARDGLPGEHHFYVTFRTTAPGVRMSQRLRDKHPDEMTIVLQHQFWDLSIGEHAFEVGLSFSGVPERLLVPFDAITTFFDPSVQFGLKFETQAEPEETAAQPEPPAAAGPGKALRGAGSEPSLAAPAPVALPARKPAAGLPAIKSKPDEAPGAGASRSAGKDAAANAGQPDDDAGGAQVVSLDSFRKKT